MPIVSTAPGVSTIAKSGSTGLKGNVTLSQGTNITLTQSGQDISIAASASSTPTMTVSSIFETAGRFTDTVTGSGSVTYGTAGQALTTGATGTSSASSVFTVQNLSGNNVSVFAGSPIFSVNVGIYQPNAASGTGSSFYGLGTVTVTGSGHTYTTNHIGFKILKSGGTVSLYATQGDGTTENASAALTTVVANDVLDLLLKVNSTTSVDYYWRKNGGALSAATNLTTNLPTAANGSMQFSTSNDATAFGYNYQTGSFHYER